MDEMNLKLGMRRLIWLLLSLCLGYLATPASAAPAAVSCVPGIVPVLPLTQLLEDPSRTLDFNEVAVLGDERFFGADTQAPSLAFTHSAIWLRFRLENGASAEVCRRWLTVGEPRLENLQVYLQREGRWETMRAGSDHPLEQWAIAERQPRFLLEVDPGESIQVLVRVVSRSWMAINPRIWDGPALLEALSHSQLLDGLTLGVMLLVLPIGLVIALLTRFPLLLMNSLLLLFYFAVVVVVNGYLFYWPALLPWSREIVALLSACTFVTFLSYCFVLLRVRLLGAWLRPVFILYTLCGALILSWGAVGDFVWTRNLFILFRNVAYVLIPLAFAIALYRRVRLGWLAWFVSGLMLVQGVIEFTGHVENDVWLFGEDRLGLSSALFLAFLLICTLISGVVHARQRERKALDELTFLQQAENERLESQVQLRTRQLSDSLQARSALLARISHDLRTPLGSIIHYARELKQGPVAEQPERIERNARQQLELLDDLLEFSRSELQQIELSLQPGYLFGFLREIEEEGRYLAVRQHNRLQCVLADGLPVLVNADFRQLRRILINLLNNAAKYTRDGLILLKVESLPCPSGLFRLRFIVQDNGVGVPQDFREQLAKPFQRGSNTLTTKGFGLGLSIVSELLGQMGSELHVAENPQGGSIFSFELELESASEDEMEQFFLESHVVPTDGAERRIVLVDDVELTRTFLGDLLGGYGFDVQLASGGDEALDCLAAGPVDLLITDQIMPGMDGWALLREVRRCWPELPVLLYSASPARPGAGQQGLTFDGALLKPATTEELLARIERLCSESTLSPTS